LYERTLAQSTAEIPRCALNRSIGTPSTENAPVLQDDDAVRDCHVTQVERGVDAEPTAEHTMAGIRAELFEGVDHAYLVRW